MSEHLNPIFRKIEMVQLIGTMAIYDSQSEASQCIPQQWREFRAANRALSTIANLYGASPCTSDHKIHHFCGVELESAKGFKSDERLTLEAGEYAVVRVEDTALLGGTWNTVLGTWLPASGRKEKAAPEFERYRHLGRRHAYRTGRDLDSSCIGYGRLIEAKQTVVADGHAMCVTTKVAKYAIRLPKSRLGIDYPVLE